MKLSAYLDNNATTAPLPEVTAAMAAAFDQCFANPSSKHKLGTAARRALENARQGFANFLSANQSSEVIFTSTATEAIALAFHSAGSQVQQVAVGTSEHSAVLDAASQQEAAGIARLDISVSRSGVPLLDGLEDELSRRKTFVSLSLVNNETGVILDIQPIAALCRKYDALLHIDAVQAPGRVPVNVIELDCDYLTISPHKFHGPKGTGILYARANAPRRSLIGGYQEAGFRGGTENVPAIVGAGIAVEALGDWSAQAARIAHLRDRLEQGILTAVPGAQINGIGARRVANTSNIYLPRRNAAEMVEGLSRHGVFVSAGAACSTGGTPSHVIRAMGYHDERANSSVRFSLSRFTTVQQVDLAISSVSKVYKASPRLETEIFCPESEHRK